MITPEQFALVVGAITALIVAVGGLWVQVRSTHQLVNSRMTELLAVTKASARAEGQLEGPSPTRILPATDTSLNP